MVIDTTGGEAAEGEDGGGRPRASHRVAEAVQLYPVLSSVSRRLLSPSPELAFAIRYGTAVSAAVWLGHVGGLVGNRSMWILITVLMVMQPRSGGSLLKGALRTCGTLAAFATSIILFGLFAQNPPLLLAGFFLQQAIAGYGYTGPRFQYAWLVWAFTTGIVLADTIVATETVETIAFQRASMVGLGLLIVFLVDSLLWPARAEPTLRRSLAGHARQIGGALRLAIAGTRPDAPPARKDSGAAPGTLTSALALADAARSEVGVSRARVEMLMRAASLLEALAVRARRLTVPADTPEDVAAFGGPVEAALVDAANALEAGRAAEPFVADLERSLATLEASHPQGPTRSASLAATLAQIRDLVSRLVRLEDALSGEPDFDAIPSAPLASRLCLDPMRVRLGLRAAITVCAVIVTTLALGWGLSPVTFSIAFMLAAVPTRGAASQLVTLVVFLLAGAWILAILAIVFLGPHLGRVPEALAFPFTVAGVLAYLTASRPQLEVARYVAGLIVLMPFFAGTRPPTDLYGLYSLVCFAVVAIVVGLATTRLLWPATAVSVFREQTAAQIELCLGTLKAAPCDDAGPAARRPLLALLRDYSRRLGKLGMLHGQARHEPIELSLDDTRRSDLLARLQELFDAVLDARMLGATQPPPIMQGEVASGPLGEAHRQTEAALEASMQAVARALRKGPEVPQRALPDAQAAAETAVDELWTQADTGPVAEVGAFLVWLNARRRVVECQREIEAWLADWERAARMAVDDPRPS